jgi:3-hydroxybutyryl-CoA dehydrogenase
VTKEIVGVVGAGTMGAGIAQLALEHGHEVVLHDVDQDALERGRARIREGLGRRAAKLDLDADTIEAWVDARLDGLRESEDLDAVGGEADIVIAAALEDLGLKQEIFRALDAAASPDALLTSNTSALSIAAIASVTADPGRVVGLHFFNPAPVMPLVEVVAPAAASPNAVVRAESLAHAWGKTTVRSTDSPGFIVNRVNRPFTLEALAILEDGAADIRSVDAAVRDAGYPMGPFELMDLIGVDVNLAVATAIWRGFGNAERFRPSPIQQALVERGELGRKTGAGFYEYPSRQPRDAELGATPSVEPIPGDTIVERLTLAIVAEAYRARADGVAAASDIDTALRLGAGHPRGPFEWVAARGPREVAERLKALESLGPRFEAPPCLVEEATEQAAE